MREADWAREAETARAWPFVEARALRARLKDESRTVVFQTGYGPSGRPHIGTFGEVARTTMVRNAFRLLSKDRIKTRLICFSDDLDGMRKVPDDAPAPEKLHPYLQKPLSQVPDPEGKAESFAAANNARLCAFLDRFAFDYTFVSASSVYASGRFDGLLRRVAAHYEQIMEIMLPTLGEERRETYAPILPICPHSGRILQVPLRLVDRERAVFSYHDPLSGESRHFEARGGQCKLQWKADWALRWAAFGVDYEMAGKDLAPSRALASKIVRLLGHRPPGGMTYELFLDEHGQKISKTKGNGLSIEQWLEIGPTESLALFMFRKPTQARHLHPGIIGPLIDEYATQHAAYDQQGPRERLENPLWHIHAGRLPQLEAHGLSFAMLLNLVSALNDGDKGRIWGFVSRYDGALSPATSPKLDRKIDYAIAFFRNHLESRRAFRPPHPHEVVSLQALRSELRRLPEDTDAQTIQTLVYEIGKAGDFDKLKDWFTGLYEVLLGQDHGPRFGSFVALYGIKQTCDLIDRALARV